MRSSQKHLEALHDLVRKFDKESGDVVLGRMLPELGSIVVALAEELDRAQRTVVRLTWALLFVAILTVVVAFGQLGVVRQSSPIASAPGTPDQAITAPIDATHIVAIGQQEVRLPQAQWAVMSNEQPDVAENFESVARKAGQVSPQVISVFKLPMSDDRRLGVRIAETEYVEAFSVNPKTITIQIRVDRGRYWVLSRESFDAPSELIRVLGQRTQPDLSQQRAVIQAFQRQIDSTRAWIDLHL